LRNIKQIFIIYDVKEEKQMQAIILAGGKGSRLRPFTKVMPKPLIPIADDLSILEVILKQLKFYGFNDIILAVNHMSELLKAFFQNGESLGLNISYSKEEKFLGTAGPLSIINNLDENFLVMNGDILTTLNYKDLWDYHLDNESNITISSFRKQIKIDLGVLKTQDNNFEDYIEKPVYDFIVSMGIYVMNKSIVKLIPQNQYFDIPDLILKAKSLNNKIKLYSGDYNWLDIGRIDDYENALKIFEENRSEFLPHK
jgi:NDP-sugar pyrophosphorylase family protein